MIAANLVKEKKTYVYERHVAPESFCALAPTSSIYQAKMYSSLALLALSAPSVHAWGTLGHETVAFIASNFVQAKTKTWAQGILDDTSNAYLANVATWADSYRYTAAGKFSAPYHFIDAEDNPPKSCSVNFDRDCGSDGCSVSAIANYTQRVQQPGSLSATEVNYALRFLIHFLGDVTQPLHDEALEIGGNDIDVTWDSESTNLHHIWDTEMPEKLRGGYALSDAQAWAANLTTEIKTGIYKSQAKSWLANSDISDAQSSALAWASDANKYVCSVVIPKGASAVETGNLDGAYYNSAISTIELQIAKGGYRLADWLDKIAATQTTKRSDDGEYVPQVDLSGAEFLPPPRELSRAKLARRAIGYDCKH